MPTGGQELQKAQRSLLQIISAFIVGAANDPDFPAHTLSELSSIFTPCTPRTPSTSELFSNFQVDSESAINELDLELELDAVYLLMTQLKAVIDVYEAARNHIQTLDMDCAGSPESAKSEPLSPEPMSLISTPSFNSIQASYLREPLLVMDSTPSYSGNFDICSMNTPSLKRVYLPHGTFGAPQHRAVFHEIMKYQAKSDFAFRCHLPLDECPGRPMSGILQVPSAGASIDGPLQISLSNIVLGDILLTDAELAHFPDPLEVRCRGPGVWASVGVAEQLWGIDYITGSFRMKRVWWECIDVYAEDMVGANHEYTGIGELFEGFFTFDVSYSQWMSHTEGTMRRTYKFAFWAVKARMDNGEDIGMDESY